MPIRLKKEEVDEMMKLKGNVRGNILRGHFNYIKELKGEEEVNMILERLKELGYPVNPAEFTTAKWYPEALSCLIILVTAEVFQWEEKDVFQMAYDSAKYSLVVRIFMRYLLNIEKVFKEVSRYWRQHFDFGEMKVIDFNEKEKFGIIRLYGYHKYHPLICIYHQGYFTKIAELAVASKKVKVEHPKCLFSGNENYEEFKIIWE